MKKWKVEKPKCLQLMKLIVYNCGNTKMNKYNVKILEDIKEVQIIAVYYSRNNWQKNIKYR